jgi:hypothetical protein
MATGDSRQQHRRRSGRARLERYAVCDQGFDHSWRLHAVVDRGYEEDPKIDPKVAEYLHISEAFEHAREFDLIYSHYDFMALSYARLVKTPVLTTVNGFSSPRIMPVYQKYRNGYFVSIGNSDRGVRHGSRHMSSFLFWSSISERIITFREEAPCPILSKLFNCRDPNSWRNFSGLVISGPVRSRP